ncbi:uncharacterized protein N7506_007713 [Penicillium brevicompactum]|uniref:uncharacterized protein n=1 Tax=Penicillium brevicompactum TaxID=5074 RepID=UPI0025400053|nr:uncharacterized protein N7506_007713 [Penicillium brevicompactum]KAJ5333930.1 hypothetical protein N7506_007713 [Penicillium brevicompactum]
MCAKAPLREKSAWAKVSEGDGLTVSSHQQLLGSGSKMTRQYAWSLDTVMQRTYLRLHLRSRTGEGIFPFRVIVHLHNVRHGHIANPKEGSKEKKRMTFYAFSDECYVGFLKKEPLQKICYLILG